MGYTTPTITRYQSSCKTIYLPNVLFSPLFFFGPMILCSPLKVCLCQSSCKSIYLTSFHLHFYLYSLRRRSKTLVNPLEVRLSTVFLSLDLFCWLFRNQRFALSIEWHQRENSITAIYRLHDELSPRAAVAPSVRGPSAQQAETVPYNSAAVWLRHLTWDWRARAHTGLRTRGEFCFLDLRF